MVGNVVTTLFGLFHCTTEQGRKFVPVTVKVSAGLPAPMVVCDRDARAGDAGMEVGVVSVKGTAGDVPIELVTVTLAVPENAAAAAGIAEVNCVALTKVVGSCAPFQFKTASLVKFVPFTVSVKPCALQDGVDATEVAAPATETEVMPGGVPGVALIVKGT